MNTLIVTIVLAVLALGAGGFISWFYFIKLKKPKTTEAAIASVASSVSNDKDRDKVISEIDKRIKENEEIRKKIEEKLKK